MTNHESPITNHQSPVSNHQSRATNHAAGSPAAILLMGPTASGKTAVAAALAQRFPVEIISVDSAQVFRHMDVGTAKPGRDVLQHAPHHLIDILDPTERYSAAQFVEDAARLMAQIGQRGRIPLLVGGTMLYFKALRDGLSQLPPADPNIRLVIDAMAAQSGWPALHAELERVDADTAARLEPADAQRIQRALEIFYVTGQPMSALIAEGRQSAPPYRLISVALEPGDRAVLHERIAERFEMMLELGLIGEVRRLRAQFSLDASLPSMRAVGYRQVWQYLDGEFGLSTLREKGVAATRQLAKRQLTWLRSWDGAVRFDCLAGGLVEQVEAHLDARLELA
jgi:tRNA dimethylallyltransferase